MTEPHDQLPHVVPTTHAPARQKAWWSAVALVLVLGGGYALYARQSPPPAPPKPIPVKLETVAVERADLEQVVNATGNVVAQDYVDVGSKVAGQISDVEVVIGEAVKAGRLLATVAPAVQNSRIESNRATLARLKAELAGQNAQLDFAQLQFQRQTQLKAENATREESYESSRMNMYAAASRVDATNAQIQQTEAAIREDEAAFEGFAGEAIQLIEGDRLTLVACVELDLERRGDGPTVRRRENGVQLPLLGRDHLGRCRIEGQEAEAEDELVADAKWSDAQRIGGG